MKNILVLLIILLTTHSITQVNVQWVQNTRGVSIAVDGQDNVYTVDYDYNPAGDIYLTKRDAQGNFIWEEKFDQMDNSKWEKATWVATDNLGNILVSGTLMSGYSNPVEAASILMKFDSAGNLVWRNVYESSFDGSYTKKCLVDQNNNIYVLGMGSGTSGYVTKVKKFSPDGTTLWTYYDANGIGAPINFKFTPDDAIVITGRAIFGSINGYAKIDMNGNHIWSYPSVSSLTIGDAEGDDFGNTYLVHGEYVTNGGTELKKISPTGSLIWSNVFSNLAGFRVEVGSDNQPVVCGFPNVNSFGSSFIKVDSNGSLVWSNLDADSTFALMLHAKLIMDQNNNIYLAAGTLTEMAVCKVNNDGTSAWTVTMPGSYANDIVLGNDNNVYVVGGNTAKINQGAVTSLNDDEATPDVFILEQNYPNPFNPATTISFSIPSSAFTSLKIYDVLGNEVGSLLNDNLIAGYHVVDFKAEGLRSGVYFYKLESGNYVETKKMILLK
ncbi:MAG: T9SS type A sorting domain-containing protein [Ignavibacteriaceae bacterium]|nr:T9SS type A sorting domain-containing protein [Ignavibacteriaceae bacterium]